MQGKTLQQVIDSAKSGVPVSAEECREAMLALHSMLSTSLMALEVIADKADNAESLYYTTNAIIGNIDQVRQERERWMNTVPADYLEAKEATQRKLDSYINR